MAPTEETLEPGETARLRFGTRVAPAVTGFTRALFSKGKLNQSQIHPGLEYESWVAISDGKHNLTTDLIFWRDHFYLVHSSSPWHIASTKSKILVWKSKDARDWQLVANFRMPGGDIRDPKFGAIGHRLYLYLLKNVGFVAEPCSTSLTVTEDGINWSPIEECDPKGWLFWRPKSFDGKEWFMPAYWHEHGRSILLKSDDGAKWTEVSEIYAGDHNDETDIEFLPNGDMVATARLEFSSSLLGHTDASTLVAMSSPPYKEWKGVKCKTTRLDGPNLFAYQGEVYAVGRRHPDSNRRFNKTGSFLGNKRTALFKVGREGLVHLSDLPSCGDTGYAGVVTRGDDLFICYYTNDVKRDYPWVVGMFLPSEIRIARVSLSSLQTICS